MDSVRHSQEFVEKTAVDKFSAIQEKVKASSTVIKKEPVRLSPQLSCTIEVSDRDILNSISLYLCNKKGKMLNMSTVIRSLIRLGNKYKEELEVL